MPTPSAKDAAKVPSYTARVGASSPSEPEAKPAPKVSAATQRRQSISNPMLKIQTPAADASMTGRRAPVSEAPPPQPPALTGARGGRGEEARPGNQPGRKEATPVRPPCLSRPRHPKIPHPSLGLVWGSGTSGYS